MAHTLAYSIVGLQEMNLAYKNPIIFWDTANLIVDSGAMNLEEEFQDIENLNEDEIEEDDVEDNEEKVKNSSSNYGKIASAIGKMRARGLAFSLPNINTSDITFSPDLPQNRILYGLKGITKIGNQLIKEILEKRPYSNIEDFLDKIKINKPQMINLIKAGVFDELYNDKTRKDIMDYYINLIADKKNKLTLQNMSSLIKYNLIPKELDFEKRLFNFNKYIKKPKIENYYKLDTTAMRFYEKYFDMDLLENLKVEGNERNALVPKKDWDALYKKGMNPVRDWLKENQQLILNKINSLLVKEVAEKYTEGSISKWEMDSLSFYYHDHELKKLKYEVYEISDYFKLPNEPEIERTFQAKDGGTICLYKISRIAGTVIDKDKNKNTVTLLTPEGVVTVKIWKNQFNVWDKQISEVGADGKKHVIEKSWFTRGTKLIITGIKRENTFIPKKYKDTEWPLFEKILDLDDKGFILNSQTERQEVE